MTTTQKHLRTVEAVLAATAICIETGSRMLAEINEIHAEPTAPPESASRSMGDAASVLIDLTKLASAFFSPADNTNRSQPS